MEEACCHRYEVTNARDKQLRKGNIFNLAHCCKDLIVSPAPLFVDTPHGKEDIMTERRSRVEVRPHDSQEAGMSGKKIQLFRVFHQ